jgi:hypothetical protein
MKMTELEMAELGRSRFLSKLEDLLRNPDVAAKPREVIGFEAANAVAAMEPNLTYEQKIAYHDGVNYAVQQWIMSPQISHVDEE